MPRARTQVRALAAAIARVRPWLHIVSRDGTGEGGDAGGGGGVAADVETLKGREMQSGKKVEK